MKFTAPAITPEQLYLQDKRRREWDAKDREAQLCLEAYYKRKKAHA